jgi:superoxide dismutase, Cu-Zn family
MLRRSFASLSMMVLATVVSAQTLPVSRTNDLKDASGAVLGKVTVTGAPHGVLLRIEAKGLTPGWHGMHFHEKANCDDPAFKTAGAHVHSKTPVVHGLLNAEANDAGDLPNLFVGPDGAVTVEIYSTMVTLKGGDERPALLDNDGSALIIHANQDDYQSQPIGGSGGRVACAAIQ